MVFRLSEIPLLAQTAGLRQTLDLYARTEGHYAAFDVIQRRSGAWFNPELVRAAGNLEQDPHLWHGLRPRTAAMEMARDFDPGSSRIAGEERIDTIRIEKFRINPGLYPVYA